MGVEMPYILQVSLLQTPFLCAFLLFFQTSLLSPVVVRNQWD
jgi:hypothetical protein